jgi:hypothetical protein
MSKEIVSMSYLRFEAHQLVSTRLDEVIGEIPHTPLDEAVEEAMRDIGTAVGSASRQAA